MQTQFQGVTLAFLATQTRCLLPLGFLAVCFVGPAQAQVVGERARKLNFPVVTRPSLQDELLPKDELLPTNDAVATADLLAPESAGGGAAGTAGTQTEPDAGNGATETDGEPEAVESADVPEVNPNKLTLADVVASVYRSFPTIQQARLQRGVADGEVLEAYGAFDLKLQGYTLNEPTGFYRNFRHGISVARQTWWGGYLSAGHRIGRGDFQPWYKERETNEGGEFKLGLGIPLLQGRAIDPARVAVFQAGVSQNEVQPLMQQEILLASLEAAIVYWEWVAAGARLLAQEELLELAKNRQTQFEIGAKAGRFAPIDVVFNRQLVAERESKRLETLRKFQSATFKLSFYLRDNAGQPMLPSDDWLPLHFPILGELPPGDFAADFATALSQRPELVLLNLDIQRLRIDRQLACNQILPTLDLIAEASQDTGIPASSSNDKGQFELVVGLMGEVPIQRSKARGKIQQLNGKQLQLDQKIRMQRNKIGIELQTARNALMVAQDLVNQAELALEAAFETLVKYRFAFLRGYADLLYLNILETKANETEIKLVDAQASWFIALAQMQAALGLDPLEQAMLVTELPTSTRKGPGDMPMDVPSVPDDFDEEWEIHSEAGRASAIDDGNGDAAADPDADDSDGDANDP